MILNGTEYAYLRNAQNDIVGLINSAGVQVVAYTYSTWGEALSITGSLASTLGQQNPYRYRGYRYDSETGLYYLQSRYYNPQWGRFLNADGLIDVSRSIVMKNLFEYCSNSPVRLSDQNGDQAMVNDSELTAGFLISTMSIVYLKLDLGLIGKFVEQFVDTLTLTHTIGHSS